MIYTFFKFNLNFYGTFFTIIGFLGFFFRSSSLLDRSCFEELSLKAPETKALDETSYLVGARGFIVSTEKLVKNNYLHVLLSPIYLLIHPSLSLYL